MKIQIFSRDSTEENYIENIFEVVSLCTDDVDESQELTEEISVRPPVVMFQVISEVV